MKNRALSGRHCFLITGKMCTSVDKDQADIVPEGRVWPSVDSPAEEWSRLSTASKLLPPASCEQRIPHPNNTPQKACIYVMSTVNATSRQNKYVAIIKNNKHTLMPMTHSQISASKSVPKVSVEIGAESRRRNQAPIRTLLYSKPTIDVKLDAWLVNGHFLSVWIHCCKRPNYDFCVSQGSVATALRWGRLNCSRVRQVVCWCCSPKIIKIGQRYME